MVWLYVLHSPWLYNTLPWLYFTLHHSTEVQNLTLQWLFYVLDFHSIMALLYTTSLYSDSISLYLIVLDSAITLLDSTSAYNGSTSLYFTQLYSTACSSTHCTLLYHSSTSLSLTLLDFILPCLYFTLVLDSHYSTMALLASTSWPSLTSFYLTLPLLDSTQVKWRKTTVE